MHIIDIKPETVFQALSDPIRIRIIRLLSVTGEEACLCEFVDSLLEPQYKLSRHIKVLKQAGLLSATKDGRWVYHRLIMSAEYLMNLYQTITLLSDSEGQYASDLTRFKQRMTLRESGRCQIGVQTEKFQAESSASKREA
ncbi:ArsR/SmtB family transcription factor [sulfur-oxidizing endosymbiont of Gigantopelta aegis]|uniref:ArsR/SmtB family transcription factor n=1 Tax=sulfur-oxidizing endosymbiont of Gigantopelta aegis TaxID=2794934 RepID=UPI0018DDCD82|nr:metalloregulator ArsR/SmtB family transcription factor [sulfur-oxidizing endosymbiont of Gigantopelta aegis]